MTTNNYILPVSELSNLASQIATAFGPSDSPALSLATFGTTGVIPLSPATEISFSMIAASAASNSNINYIITIITNAQDTVDIGSSIILNEFFASAQTANVFFRYLTF